MNAEEIIFFPNFRNQKYLVNW